MDAYQVIRENAGERVFPFTAGTHEACCTPNDGELKLREIPWHERRHQRNEAVRARHRKADEEKEKLNEAFKALRKLGFIARQNYLCCGSCAGYACGLDVEKRIKDEKLVLGAVHYNRQAADAVTEGGTLYLSFGGNDGLKDSDNKRKKLRPSVKVPTKQAGFIIKGVLEACGLTVTWDGDESQCIQVDMSPGCDKKARVY